MKKFNRILSFLMALVLISGLALPVLADTYYLEDGSVSIAATSTDGGQTQIQTVTQNGATVNDTAPIVTQKDSGTATTNTVTIESSGGATAVVTVENVNIDTGSDTAGGDTSPIDVVNGSQAIITVSGENKVNSGHDVSGNHDYSAAVHVGDSTVVIQGADGKGDTLNASNDNTMGAAIGSDYNEDFTGTLIIQDVTVTTTDGNIGAGMLGNFSGELHIDGANVTATGGREEPGIGAGSGVNSYQGNFTGTVMISGQSQVTATGNKGGAGVGGGYDGDFSETGTVIVTEGSTLNAMSNERGAGVGGGFEGNFFGTVIVAEDSTLNAKSDVGGAGVGAGCEDTFFGTVIVTGGSEVTAAANEKGAGIGSSGSGQYYGTVIQETGSTITATGGDGGIGLGLSDPTRSRKAEVKENVDLTEYLTVLTPPADPALLPWHSHNYTGHSWDDGTVTNKPTEYAEGVRTYTCGCGMTRTESIPRLPASEPERAPAYDADFWADVEEQLRAAKKGGTVTVDAAWRTTMPASIMEAIAETGVTLIIQWNGGEDITIHKPYDGEKKYTIFYLKDLAVLLAD